MRWKWIPMILRESFVGRCESLTSRLYGMSNKTGMYKLFPNLFHDCALSAERSLGGLLVARLQETKKKMLPSVGNRALVTTPIGSHWAT
jgi:hypothetical protein